MGRIEDIKQRLLPHGDPLIIEVGACYFNHTRVFLDTFPACTLYTFEPHPRLAPLYEQVIGSAEPRCSFFQCAVGDADGTTTLRMSRWLNDDGQTSREWEPSSSIVPCADFSPQYPQLHFPDTAEVKLTTLDTWARENGVGHVDFIWTDVQGAERNLIAGATELLARTDYIQLEFGECGPYPGASLTKAETLALLEANGFRELPAFTRETVWGPNGEWNAGDLLFANTRTVRSAN